MCRKGVGVPFRFGTDAEDVIIERMIYKYYYLLLRAKANLILSRSDRQEIAQFLCFFL